MAATFFAVPHLQWTWQQSDEEGGVPVHPLLTPCTIPLVSTSHLEYALGLPEWELDELREEIDRRASLFHRQSRVVLWLCRRFRADEEPRRLFEVLFPGLAESAGEVDFVRSGGQLYARVESGAASSPLALHLSWAVPPERQGDTPSRFRAHRADPRLIQALCRFSGETPDEIRLLLERTIAVIPREDSEQWIGLDRWRSRGIGALTGLGWPYGTPRPLNEPLEHADAEWEHWLHTDASGLRVEGKPKAVFDALAIERVQEATRQAYAAILAHLDWHGGGEPTAADLALLDTERHLREVLMPLIRWLSDPTAHEHIARHLGRERAEIATALVAVQEAWSHQLNRSWIAPPRPNQTSLLSLLMPHLVTLTGSLRALLVAEPDDRAAHRDVLQLFTAFYLREAPLERLWVRGLADTLPGETSPLPEDVPGDWFWGTWQRVLDATENEHVGG